MAADDIAATRTFYAELGLVPGPRPRFARDGLWLYADAGKPILHVIETDAMPEMRRGVLDHMAFFSTDVQRALDWIRAKGTPFRLQRAPEPEPAEEEVLDLIATDENLFGVMDVNEELPADAGGEEFSIKAA